jgi:hypothetical protein
MTRRDWLIFALLYVTVQGLQLGVWWWGYTATETIPLDMQQPDLVRVGCLVAFLSWAAFAYLITLRIRRTHAGSRRLSYVVFAAFLVPALVLAVVARCGGPRFTLLVLQSPYLGASLGCQLGIIQRLRGQPEAGQDG